MPNSQPKETLSFKIGLSATFWDKLPEYSVLINDTLIERRCLDDDSIRYVEFTADLDEGTTNRLKIRLENKTDQDTIESEDKSAIVKDMLLNIKSIEIDQISINQLMWDSSKFIADSPAIPTLVKCVNLGWNGTYVLEFTTPFYLWLLENL
jgi:hypothetical protein